MKTVVTVEIDTEKGTCFIEREGAIGAEYSFEGDTLPEAAEEIAANVKDYLQDER